MDNPHGIQRLEVEDLTLREIIYALTLKQAIAIVSFVGALVAAAFTSGLMWETHLRSSEVQPLKARLEIVDVNAKKLEDELQLLQQKERFLELTAILQFQAMLRGKKLEELYHRGAQRFAMTENQYTSLLASYVRVINEISNPADERRSAAQLSRSRDGLGTLTFRNDGSFWILLRMPVN